MNQTQIFNHPLFGEIRAIELNSKPYFVGNDIARALHYARPHEAVSSHCKVAVGYRILTNGGEQATKIIPEGDVYRLIVKAADQSRNPEIKAKAEQFEKWLFDEVIPTIRQHGAYLTPSKIEEVLLNPDTIIDLATQLKAAREENEKQKPLVAFAEICLQSSDSIKVRDLAHSLSSHGITIGQNRLFEKLREWGLISQKSTEPTQRAVEQGLFEVVTGVKQKPSGEPFTWRTPYVTVKGQVYVTDRLRKEMIA
ncbi:phage antirepressor [Paenibacillus bouchesdurhonensis]|uniref:phage antirepressor n=1 Tax=Paenibacillus bouchesdurhonensis TaxID=1870990 RepID=UPI000DA618CE|nr:phage antirepressor KilAC domain-containing protein [Paenibacillus bouchesdurhonensis]